MQYKRFVLFIYVLEIEKTEVYNKAINFKEKAM